MNARDSFSARLIASASAADDDVAPAQKNVSLAASLRPDLLHPALVALPGRPRHLSRAGGLQRRRTRPGFAARAARACSTRSDPSHNFALRTSGALSGLTGRSAGPAAPEPADRGGVSGTHGRAAVKALVADASRPRPATAMRVTAARPGSIAASGRSGGGAAERLLAPETAPDFSQPPLRTRLSSQGWALNWGWQGTTAAPAPRRAASAALDNRAPIGAPV